MWHGCRMISVKVQSVCAPQLALFHSAFFFPLLPLCTVGWTDHGPMAAAVTMAGGIFDKRDTQPKDGYPTVFVQKPGRGASPIRLRRRWRPRSDSSVATCASCGDAKRRRARARKPLGTKVVGRAGAYFAALCFQFEAFWSFLVLGWGMFRVDS